MSDCTITYLSSNKETPEFERKTRETLLQNCGDLPIIAVTQKPVDLGPNSTNIVIGDVGASGYNFCRQLQIAVEVAKTRFVISAESDCIYPPDYFTWRPPKDDIVYRNTNQYVLKYKQGFFKKNTSTFAQISGRDFLLERLNYLFVLKPESPAWSTEMRNFPKEYGVRFLESYAEFRTENPCVSFKTGRGMRLHTVTEHEEFTEIPYWGKAEDLRKHYEG